MITPYLDYGKASACKESGLPQPAEFADGQIWYAPNGTPFLIYQKEKDKKDFGAQSLRTGRLYDHLPKRIEKMVYCPNRDEYFQWAKYLNA
jgi:hypothetical protein